MQYPVTVILPVYNGEAYLRKAIDNVLSQSLENFEFIICDDLSTDSSVEIIESFNDVRIQFIKNPLNKGLFATLNRMIKLANGNLIKLWAQDDIMLPDCLEAFVTFHQKHPAIGFSYSGRDIIDENGMVKKTDIIDKTPEIISTDLHARIAFFTGSIAGNIANVCIDRKALDRVGLFNEEMKISADFDMWVRLAKDHEVGFIQEKLIQLRDHDGQLSRKEKFYINHVQEDMIVYRNLLSYVKPDLKKEGKLLLRNHKFIFYYTLMVKAFMKGQIKSAHSFYKELCSIDNFLRLSISFMRSKLFKAKKPSFIKLVKIEKEIK